MNRFRVLQFRVVGVHLLRARMIIWRRRAVERAADGPGPVAQTGRLPDWRWSHLAAAVATAGIMAPTAAIAATNHPYPARALPPPPTGA
jgi:hypothetical protein